MARMFQATWIVPIILASASLCLAGLNVTYEWKYIDYVWKTCRQKKEAVDAGKYDHTRIIINDVQPFPDGRVLVTTPKYSDNPASLSVISAKTGRGGPLLEPYPNWSWHTSEHSSEIISVNKVFLDDYNRLWLVDSGKIGKEQVRSARILVFDTTTDELVFEYEIPSDLSHSPDDESLGLLELMAVEMYGDSIEDASVYVSDIEGFGLLIRHSSNIWRLNHNIFKPNPDHTTFTINFESITLSIGISGEIFPDGYFKEPSMIFKPMSSVKGHAVTLNDLHNSQSSDENITFWTTDFTEPSQEISRTFTKDGIFFGGFTTETMIACWNLENPLELLTIALVEINPINLQFISSIKNLNGKLWAASNRFQKYVLGTMNFADVNFRIMTGDIASLVKGTVCEPTGDFTVASSFKEKAFSLYDGTS